MSVVTGITATAAAALLAVGALTTAGPALADSSPSASSGAGSLTAACHRVDKQLTRATKLQTRLHADANTRGSIAYLQARIDKATAAGETSLAKVLTDRMAVRKQVDAALPEVLEHLKDAKATCESAGEGA